MANWKTPGCDLVQNFWIKHLTSLHGRLTETLNHVMNKPEEAPEWFTKRKTTLLFKNGNQKDAKNYRLITCLPTLYKLTTLILTDMIYSHVVTKNILPVEQKGMRRYAKGCKDQLLIDKMITEDAKKKKRNVSMMWIDYQKAYDSVPHSWIKHMMKLYKIDKTITNFITHLMPTWKTTITLHN